jgi:hypothetical protein
MIGMQVSLINIHVGTSTINRRLIWTPCKPAPKRGVACKHFLKLISPVIPARVIEDRFNDEVLDEKMINFAERSSPASADCC